jgi:glycosyltransferase involved in cell wall biosynthesis
LTGENIICFAKDWSEHPTSNNHVMGQLARNNQVLWLNSISMRTPSLTSGRDLRKIGRKVAGFFRGAARVQDGLWIYTPLVLPLPHSKLATALNGWLLRTTLRILRRRLGMREFQLWTFLPNVAEYVGTLDEALTIYYCVDEWAGFNYLDGAKVVAAERRLCERADVVFGTARSLVESRRCLNPETYLATHGVDHSLFARALCCTTSVPPDLASLPQPVLGFYGTIQDRIDFELLAHLAERHPEWTIAMLGNVRVDTSRLARYPNIRFLGSKPYSELPNYCRGFAVGLIPYLLTETTIHANPIKLREYLSAGLPVVSTALPEVSYYRDYCQLARDPIEFEQAVAAAVREDTPELRRRRSDAMRRETWEQKVAELGTVVMQAKARKAAR